MAIFIDLKINYPIQFVYNPNNKFIEKDPTKDTDDKPTTYVAVLTFLKTERNYMSCRNIHSAYLKFLDASDHWRSVPSRVEDVNQTEIPGQDSFKKWTMLSRLDDTFSFIFGGNISGSYRKTTIDKIKRNLHILQKNQN